MRRRQSDGRLSHRRRRARVVRHRPAPRGRTPSTVAAGVVPSRAISSSACNARIARIGNFAAAVGPGEHGQVIAQVPAGGSVREGFGIGQGLAPGEQLAQQLQLGVGPLDVGGLGQLDVAAAGKDRASASMRDGTPLRVALITPRIATSCTTATASCQVNGTSSSSTRLTEMRCEAILESRRAVRAPGSIGLQDPGRPEITIGPASVQAADVACHDSEVAQLAGMRARRRRARARAAGRFHARRRRKRRPPSGRPRPVRRRRHRRPPPASRPPWSARRSWAWAWPPSGATATC